jgi:acyl carrier protein
MEDKVREIVLTCVKEESGVSDVDVNTKVLAEDSLFDSMGIINLITLIEQRVSDGLSKTVSLDDEDAFSAEDSPFRTVDTIVDFVLGKLGK